MEFLVSKTYSQITPESAEDGDFSDRGFVWQDVPYTFRELVELLESREWYFDGSSISNGWNVIDYSTMTEEEEQLHVSCPTPRHKRYFDKALKLAGKI